MSADTPRRIIVLRHAKADWPNGVDDHERPLADRGRHQAPDAGRWLADSGINPDFVLCSTALRTRETWKLAAHELPKRTRKTVYEDRIYGPARARSSPSSMRPRRSTRTWCWSATTPGCWA